MDSLPIVQNRVINLNSKDFRVFMDFFDETSKEKEYDCLQGKLRIPDTKVNTIGLKRIREKSSQYADIDSILFDIDRLARSYMIHFQSKCPATYEKAKKLNEECKKEAATIKKCADCYESWKLDKTKKQTAYFKLVCPKPHLVIFMKVKGYPIWPAKLFYVKDGMANVECFGDYLEDDIPIGDCFLYSEKIPREHTGDEKKQKQLNFAYKEVKQHIKLVEEKFGVGSFVPAPSKVPVSDLEQHLKDMFPAAYAQSSRTTNGIGSQETSRETPRQAEQPLFGEPSTRNGSSSSMNHTSMDDSVDNDGYVNQNNIFPDDDEEMDDHDHIDVPPPSQSENSFEIKDILENYSGHDDSNADNEDSVDLTMIENSSFTAKRSKGPSGNGRNQSVRKRQRSFACKSVGNRAPRKGDRKAFESRNSSPTTDEGVIITLDDYEETAAQKKARILREYEEIIIKIHNRKTELEQLEQQKISLRKFLEK